MIVKVLLTRSWSFRTFVDHFIVAFGSNRLPKTLEGEVADWVKKRKGSFKL